MNFRNETSENESLSRAICSRKLQLLVATDAVTSPGA